VVDPDHAMPVHFGAPGLKDVQIGECETVVLVVVGQEGQCGVSMLDFCVEDRPIPAQHSLEAARAVDDVNEPRWADA